MKHLSAAQQSAILSHYSFNAEGKIRLRATAKSEPLLKLAGVTHPKPLEYYSVPVRRDGKGFLVIDTDGDHRPPVGDSDDDLFEPGGLFAGGLATGDFRAVQRQMAANQAAGVSFLPPGSETAGKVAAELAEGLNALCEIPCTRTFEIPTGPTSKLRVQIVAFEDHSLPTPLEREQWKPKKPTDVDVLAAVDALRMARVVSDLEQV